MWRLCRWKSLKLQLSWPENWHTFEAHGSHQSIPINSYGILKSIKKLYVVILTKEKKQKNMHHEVERQKYSYWSTSFQSPLSVHKLSPHRTIQLHCSASCQKPKFWPTAAHLVPHSRTDTALYTRDIATQDSTNWAWKFSWKTKVQIAKMNMEMHYVAWQ